MKRLLPAIMATAVLSISSLVFAAGESAPDASQGMLPPPGSDPRVQGADVSRQGVQVGSESEGKSLQSQRDEEKAGPSMADQQRLPGSDAPPK